MENEVSNSENGYTVVARRYRPRNFGELIGQDHIAQALEKAISAGRVGHAYLFTGARGVGKTSTARIFAKALNIRADSPADLAEDIARSIDAGDDMDVIEIDGASNRGIEEIRQLRANVNVRPSRAPHKIYIIDEVHMLTNQAFNALLKTLEEPPGHVKFIFCTTDPDKIPITVLSRCQRFDFAPVQLEAIQDRLREICHNEGFEAEEQALSLLARRAAGSMRDSQSLLEQVMSFSSAEISVEQVHMLLGTADEGRLQEIVMALHASDPLQAMNLVDESVRGGSDAGQLAEQLLGYLRDLLTAGIGGGSELLKLAAPSSHAQLQELAGKWGTQTILSAIQILDEALVRMRSSVSAVTLLEVALVQICHLEQLASIPALLEQITQAGGTPQKKKPNEQLTPTNTHSTSPQAPPRPSNAPARATDVAPPSAAVAAPATKADSSEAKTSSATAATAATPPEPAHPQNSAANPTDAAAGEPTTSSDALAQWKRAVANIDGMLRDYAELATAIQTTGSDQWQVIFPPGANQPKEYCESAARREQLQSMLSDSLHRSIRLSFAVRPGQAPQAASAVPQSSLRAQKMREMAEHPYVKRVCEVIDGEIIRVDLPRGSVSPPAGGPANSSHTSNSANGSPAGSSVKDTTATS